MAFEIGSILNSTSLSQAQDTHRVSYIKRENIFPDPFNSEAYSMSGIELLAFGIMDKGLLEPLIVKVLDENPSTGETTYQIISGHRRMKAIEYIVENFSDKAATFENIPCIIRKPKDSDDEHEELIDGNVFNRHKTDAERARELERKKSILEKRRQNGENIPGKLLTLIADEMNISQHQARKWDSINRRASETVKESFEKGDISTDTAYELSRMDTEEQDEIIEQASESGSALTAKSVREARKDADFPENAENGSGNKETDKQEEQTAEAFPGPNESETPEPSDVPPFGETNTSNVNAVDISESEQTTNADEGIAFSGSDADLTQEETSEIKSAADAISVVNAVIHEVNDKFNRKEIPAAFALSVTDKLNALKMYLSKLN